MHYHDTNQRACWLLVEFLSVQIGGLTDDDACEWLDVVQDWKPYYLLEKDKFVFSHIEIVVAHGGPTLRLRWEGGEVLALDGMSLDHEPAVTFRNRILGEVLDEFVANQRERISAMSGLNNG